MSERVKLRAKIPKSKSNKSTSKSQNTISLQSKSRCVSSPVDHIMFLQRTIGNRAVQRLIKSGALQTKLRVGAPNDIYEHEADRVAAQVMRMSDSEIKEKPYVSDLTQISRIQRLCPECEEEMQRQPIEKNEEKLQRQPEEEEEEELQAKPLAKQITPLIQKQPIEEEFQMKAEANKVQRQVEEEKTIQTKQIQSRTILNEQANVTSLYSLRIQRDLARRPPGRVAEPPTLSEDEINDAITYNNARYHSRGIRLIQDVVGAPVTGTMDANTIRMIVEWQADFRLQIDGKVGLRTLRSIVRELIREGQRNSAIRLIIDGHNMSTRGLRSIRYDSSLAGDNAETSGPIPGRSRVRIGPAAFSQGYAGLVHTIAHELEHVRQRLAGMANQNLREFFAEAIEILSAGMFWESLAGFMDDARRALFHWNRLPLGERRTNWARFVQVRNRVQRRFNSASAANRATHQATMDAYNAVVAPPP